jgi:hypothetical protein
MPERIAAHEYLSTACWHEEHDDQPDMHNACRALCKFCGASCSCTRHPTRDDNNLPLSPVDQARDAFIRLLAITKRCGVDLRHEDPDLFEALRDDPNWFWARGEIQPAEEWRPYPTNKETRGD